VPFAGELDEQQQAAAVSDWLEATAAVFWAVSGVAFWVFVLQHDMVSISSVHNC